MQKNNGNDAFIRSRKREPKKLLEYKAAVREDKVDYKQVGP